MNALGNEEEIRLQLFQLPTEILERIFSYLSYDEISASRLVSKRFDLLCRGRLNDGLTRVDRLHSQIHREIKGKLPRRESERRTHVLARHIDILGAIETRLSLLNMTYSKYMETGLCCFIPGKVLDEIFHVLHQIRSLPNPPRAHELLQELRDISSMAIEHFDEKIAPLLRTPRKVTFEESLVSLESVQKTRKIKLQRSNSMILRISRTLSLQQKLVIRQNRRIGSLQKQLANEVSFHGELHRRHAEQNRRITELEQKIVDYDQKFVDMMVEISRVRGSSGLTNDADVTKDGKPQAENLGRCSEDDVVPPKAGKDSMTSSGADEKPLTRLRKSKRLVVQLVAEPSKTADQSGSLKPSGSKPGSLPAQSDPKPPRRQKRKAVDRVEDVQSFHLKLAKK